MATKKATKSKTIAETAGTENFSYSEKAEALAKSFLNGDKNRNGLTITNKTLRSGGVYPISGSKNSGTAIVYRIVFALYRSIKGNERAETVSAGDFIALAKKVVSGENAISISRVVTEIKKTVNPEASAYDNLSTLIGKASREAASGLITAYSINGLSEEDRNEFPSLLKRAAIKI